MTIDLSNLTFTEQDDIVPASGVKEINNTGTANTLGGNDLITGSTTGSANSYPIGIFNSGIINTGAGHDIITGISDHDHVIIPNAGIHNQGIINTEDGNDQIIGITQENHGIFLIGATINTGDGNDEITGIGDLGINVNGQGIIDTGNGNDTITGTGGYGGIENFFIINTGDGNDKITGIGTSSDAYGYGIYNGGTMDTGAGNDEITGTSANGSGINNNVGTIDTGDGNDKITGTGSIGIYNNGSIKTGDGKDSIIADGGFTGTGSVLLGEGEDYIKGFGSGEFSGGNGNDKLELTPGTYTVGRWYTAVTFTKGDQLMITSEFEKLIAGSRTYDFTSLTKGQTITVTAYRGPQ